MSGETQARPSGWNVDTLHEHLSARVDNLEARLAERDQEAKHSLAREIDAQNAAVDKAFTAANLAIAKSEALLSREFHEHLVQYRHETELQLSSSDKAIAKAEQANEKRFESVNEFRATLTDQAGNFLTRGEADAQMQRILDRLDDLQRRMDKGEGAQRGTAQTMGVLLAVATVVISIVVIFINVLTGS